MKKRFSKFFTLAAILILTFMVNPFVVYSAENEGVAFKAN